jgi:hypothetical protein
MGARPECYGKDLGTAVRSTEGSAPGNASLCVTANPGKLSAKSDHVTAGKSLGAGQKGTLRLEADVFIPVAGSGQVGPELDLQNTRQVSPGAFTSSTIAVQYMANPDDPNFGNWGVWSDVQPGVAGWKYPSGLTYKLTPGVWYHVKVIGNVESNRYSDLIISTQDASVSEPQKFFDLSSHPILSTPSQASEESLWVGVVAENRWSDCGAAAPTEYRVCYDNLTIRR